MNDIGLQHFITLINIVSDIAQTKSVHHLTNHNALISNILAGISQVLPWNSSKKDRADTTRVEIESISINRIESDPEVSSVFSNSIYDKNRYLQCNLSS